jgi:hypothetical protein
MTKRHHRLLDKPEPPQCLAFIRRNKSHEKLSMLIRLRRDNEFLWKIFMKAAHMREISLVNTAYSTFSKGAFHK